MTNRIEWNFVVKAAPGSSLTESRTGSSVDFEDVAAPGLVNLAKLVGQQFYFTLCRELGVEPEHDIKASDWALYPDQQRRKT